jgi:PST family polysaccharide transporter
VAEQRSLGNRLIGFTLLPALAAVSPLVALPVVARDAGPAGWASAIAGESIGTFAAIAISYGWGTIGPALVSIAKDDAHRGRLYRESITVRLLVSAVTLPLLAIACWFIASPGYEWLAVLMGVQGALIAWSFTWFAAGVGDPWSIAVYDAIPRLTVAVLAAFATVATGIIVIYPIGGILVTVIGTGLYTLRLLRRYPSEWPNRAETLRMFRTGGHVALNDAALGAYSSIPAPLVNLTAAPTAAAGFASADKMLKLGQFLPLTLANALQSWITERHGSARGRRMRYAVSAHAAFGMIGALVLAFAGPPVSALLFGQDAAAPLPVTAALGIAFALYSVRTSLTRHLLFPVGDSRLVVRATLVGTVVGTPLMVALAFAQGPVGVAIGFAATEAITTALLIRPSRRALARLDAEETIQL